MKDLVNKRGESEKFYIASSATSTEEIGNGVHRGTRAVLDEMGISYAGKVAVQLKKSDYDKYDYFIGMDGMNRQDILKIFGQDKDNKVSLLLDYTGENRDVADPWWTGDFEETRRDVINGTNAFYQYLKDQKAI